MSFQVIIERSILKLVLLSILCVSDVWKRIGQSVFLILAIDCECGIHLFGKFSKTVNVEFIYLVNLARQ